MGVRALIEAVRTRLDEKMGYGYGSSYDRSHKHPQDDEMGPAPMTGMKDPHGCPMILGHPCPMDEGEEAECEGCEGCTHHEDLDDEDVFEDEEDFDEDYDDLDEDDDGDDFEEGCGVSHGLDYGDDSDDDCDDDDDDDDADDDADYGGDYGVYDAKMGAKGDAGKPMSMKDRRTKIKGALHSLSGPMEAVQDSIPEMFTSDDLYSQAVAEVAAEVDEVGLNQALTKTRSLMEGCTDRHLQGHHVRMVEIMESMKG